MACTIKIIDVKGLRTSVTEPPYAIRVKGIAEGGCNTIIVHTDCMKPSSATGTVVYSSGNPEGQWEVIVPRSKEGSRCECDGRIIVTAYCLSPEDIGCNQAEYDGILECVEGKGECPESLVIRAFNPAGEDITEQVLHDSCHLYGRYTFKIEVSPALFPTYNIQLTVKVDGIDITDLSSDPRISHLAADNSSFDFTFGDGVCIVEVIASVYTDDFPADGCAIKQGSIELQACQCTCPPGTTYNPDTGECDIFGCMDSNATNFNPEATIDDGSCVYPTRRRGCTDPNATNYDPEATIDDGSCVYPTRRRGCTDPDAINYDPEATIDDGSCEYENGGGGSCGIWCILAGIFLVAFPISAHISTAAYCASGILLAVQAAAIIATISWYIRLCGICCLYPFLYAGAILGIIAILIASIWLGFPGCLAVGLALLVGYVVAAAGFQSTCDSE